MTSLGRRLYGGSGLRSLFATGRDAVLIMFARTTRMLAYGASSLILALFLAELGVSDWRIGLFMSLTLAGDVALSLLLTLVADRVGRRRTLLGGAVMMVASGLVFATCDNYWVLLLAAVVGVISASGNDFGPFRAIEESTLSGLTDPSTRADVLAWYVTTSSLGQALGYELSGRYVGWLLAKDGWTRLDGYHAIYLLYVVMGLVNMLAFLGLSGRCEVTGKSTVSGASAASAEPPEQRPGTEAEPFLGGSTATSAPQSSWSAPISSETLPLLWLLWALLMMDTLADGMVYMSLVTVYLDRKFHLSKATMGDFASAAFFLCAFMSAFSGPLARRMGLVNTMVFTHTPSSAAVLLFPFPRGILSTFALLLVRMGLNNMDQAPRAALIAALVKPEERTAVMGITGTLRTLASAAGPTVTGLLAGSDNFWIAFVVAGSLRLAYDLGLFLLFINVDLHRYEPVRLDGQGTEQEDGHSVSDDAASRASIESVPSRSLA